MADKAAGLLTLINGDVALGLQIGQVMIPIIKGVISDIKHVITPQGTVSYTVVINTDQAELAAIAQISIDDLMAINHQLKEQGAKPLDVPGQQQPPIIDGPGGTVSSQ